MSTLGLYFCREKKGTMYPSFGHVYVKSWSTSPRGEDIKDGEKCILLTPECVTQGELNAQIDRLIQELEQIRALGKKKFAKREP
jgi:hypothetical protein